MITRRQFLLAAGATGAALVCGVGTTQAACPSYQVDRITNRFGVARFAVQRPNGRWVKMHRPNGPMRACVANYGEAR